MDLEQLNKNINKREESLLEDTLVSGNTITVNDVTSQPYLMAAGTMTSYGAMFTGTTVFTTSVNYLSFTPKYFTRDVVKHLLGSNEGVIIDIRYTVKDNKIEYLVSFGENDKAWMTECELVKAS